MSADLLGFESRGGRWLASGLSCAVLAASSPAGAVECAQVLTEHTVLDTDLMCPGDGLIVGADGIQIDLGGHEVRATDYDEPLTVGIRNEGHQGVEIRNGTIIGFKRGIELVGASRNLIEALLLEDGEEGIVLVESGHNHLRGNRVEDVEDAAVTLIDSDWNRIEGNRTESETGHALLLRRSDYNKVIDNDLSSDDHAIVVMQSDHNLFEGNRPYSGVDRCFLMLESNENRIIGNRCNSEDGVTLGNSHRNLIAGNSLGGDRWPLSIRGDFNRIEGNFIASANDEPATVSLDGDYNQLTGNQVRGFDTNCSRDNDPIAGIHVLRGVGNRVAGNVVTEQCFDGILVESDARKTIVRQNVAAANGDDGIDVEDPTSLVVGNTALENGDYGIEAVPGARGGGNRALANGNPAQCLEIRCNVKGRPSPPGIAGAAQ